MLNVISLKVLNSSFLGKQGNRWENYKCNSLLVT